MDTRSRELGLFLEGVRAEIQGRWKKLPAANTAFKAFA